MIQRKKFGRLYGMALTISTALMGLFVSVPVWSQGPPPFGPPVNPGRTIQVTDMTNPAPLIPVDVYRNPAPSAQDLATFAWLEFISAVSPANKSQRGTTGGSFTSSGQGAFGPLLWETYQHRVELFPYNAKGVGVPPQPWNSTPTYVVSPVVPKGKIAPSITVPYHNFNNLDEATEIGQNVLFFPKTPGKPQPQYDAQVLFEAKVNQYEWSFVNSNYAGLKPQFPPFHFSPAITLPTGTVEVKAAWRPLSSIPTAQQYRYHTASVITYSGTDANPVAHTTMYALIALHIIHKSPNYPAFTFATFQQVDDLQNQATAPPSPTGLYYVPEYQTIAYTTPPTTTFPPTGQTVNNPQINLPNGPFNTQKPFADPNGILTPLPVGAVPSIVPVTQPVAIVPGVATVNNQALAAMKQTPGFSQNFVWQYYTLAGIQAVPTSNESSPDFYLANIVVESSQPGIQLFRGFPPIANGVLTNIRNQVNVVDSYTSPPGMTSSGGCQGCHGIAQTQNGFDFSFLFFGSAGGGFNPDVVGLPTPAVAVKRLAKRKYFQ
ncbi:MAG TPA: hypothetical protein VNW97_13705 [Candidatus Saccharimonadales bacterium]|nr:hypothetical protein [Candidatus Saccharimonadales bacterium]